MYIREATEADRQAILRVQVRSQGSTNIPNPAVYPPDSLEKLIYHDRVKGRLVAIIGQQVVGHATIEEPDPAHVSLWRAGLDNGRQELPMLELASGFVDPEFIGLGIWTDLVAHRLQ